MTFPLCGGIICLLLVFSRGGSHLASDPRLLREAYKLSIKQALPSTIPTKQSLYWKPEWDEPKVIDGSDVLDFDAPRPKHLRLAIVGDSISRYQYLSLVHFIKFGRFPDPEAKPSFVYSTERGYNDFFNFSNSKLAPFEQCDCYREDKERNLENRYFYDNSTDNLVVYLNKYGKRSVKISVPAQEVDFRNHTYYSGIPSDVEKAADWGDAIRHLAALPIKPRHVILNAGHSAHFLKRESVREEIARTLQQHNMVGIYKSTTSTTWGSFQGEDNPHPNQTMPIDKLDSYEESMCKLLGHCLSMGWTFNLVLDKFRDDYHLDEPIYKRMNLQTLDLLEQMQK